MQHMNIQMKSPFGTFCLNRYPHLKKQLLRAWDAADEYLLNELNVQSNDLHDKNILIFNDAFGALSTALSQYNPIVVTDSIIAKSAIIQNLQNNDLTTTSATIISSLDALWGKYDLILIKLPKSMDYLRFFIDKISHHIDENTCIFVAGMVKSIPKTTWKLLEQTLGSTQTSLAVKKAKLIRVKADNINTHCDYPNTYIQENTHYKIYNHANVFSKKSLDIGTRFLLQNLPQLENIKDIIDLGCGNGVVGLNLIHQYPQARVMFTDESFMAVESARLTVRHNDINAQKHVFKVNNCLDEIEKESVDLIVCNPPFHESHSIGIHIALNMFHQSYNTLKSKGYFLVIANRHLPYYAHLKRIFTHVKNVASNNKFSIFLMQKN